MKKNIYNNQIINLPSPTRIRNEYIQLQLRKLHSEAEALRNGSYTLGGIKLPRINTSRNQSRLSSTMQAILLYINTQTKHLGLLLPPMLSDLIYKFEMKYHNDPSEFVKYSKLISNWLRVNLSRPNRTQGRIPNTSWDKRNLCPVELSDIFFELSKTGNDKAVREALRMALTILEAYQSVTVPTAPSLESITSPFTGKESAIEGIDVISALNDIGVDLEDWRQKFTLRNRDGQWHVSSASGPNGQALWMAHIDAKAVFNDKEVFEGLKTYGEIVDREIMDKCEDSYRLPNFFKVSKADPCHSKLHLIFEKGNKCRVIAILDYWTQETLAPLHDCVANINRAIPCDGTFDQDKIAAKVRSWTSDPTLDLYSLDLTAATDRLPLKLQKRILDHLVGLDGFSDAWESILVNRDYSIEGCGSVRYAVGQPMGAKSSFPMLALTHHVIVREAAKRANLTKFENYVILGDDIVIANKQVAENYLEIMALLGMDISLHKSVISESDTGPRVAEICKRLFMDGNEFSPIPPKLLATVSESKDMFYQLQEVLGKIDLLDHPGSFSLFSSGFLQNRVAWDNLVKLNGMPKFMTGMKFSHPFNEIPSSNYKLWEKQYGITSNTLEQFFTYVVVVEQLKRLGVILKNTEDVYSTIVKAASVSKTIGIGSPETGYLPVEQFSKEDLDEWEIVDTFHPAVEAVKSEVNRINTILMKMVSSKGSAIGLLRSGIVDSLKVSAYDTMPDSPVRESKLTRRLADLTMQSIKRASDREDKSLSYSIKLDRLNMIWNVKVAINGQCIITRSTAKIAIYKSDAQNRLDLFTSKTSFDPFKTN